VTLRILLNKWQRQQEKERYQQKKYEKRNESLKKKRIGENKKSTHESKGVRIGDVRSSGTVGMMV
jgi:hypothetical protein